MDWLKGTVPWPVLMVLLFVIVMLRANGTYWLGRLVLAGAQRSRRIRAFTHKAPYLLATRRLGEWGAPAVTVSFLTIGVQTAINLAAGAIQMPLRRYLPAVTLGCVLWALIYSTVGFVGIEAVAAVWRHSPLLAIGLAAAVLGLVVATVWRIRANRAATVGA